MKDILTGHVILLSGGLDSTTLLYDLFTRLPEKEYSTIHALSFTYGQKHESKELSMAKFHTEKYNLTHKIVNLDFLTENLNKMSALGNNIDIPEEEYDCEHRPITYVPYRNALLSMIAASYAEANDLHNIWLGVHSDDAASVYWDCSWKFINKMNQITKLNKDFSLTFRAPYTTKTKTDIVKKALKISKKIKYDFYKDTWSCYAGREKACGECGTCIDRLKAFKNNNALDLIDYE